MINVAICDEERHFCRRLEEYVSDYLKRNGMSYHIDLYHSKEEFLSLGIEMVQYTVVFSDINVNKLDGIVVAKKIREISQEVFVVFVTAQEKYILEGYKVGAVRYILKDTANLRSAIEECMDAILEKLNYEIVRKRFKFREGTKEILLDRLLYIESKLHMLEFHIMEDEMKIYTMYEVLDKVAEELEDSNFIRIHKSYFVNLKYIENVRRYRAKLSNGTELIIPKARYMYVKDRFAEYQGGCGRK